MVAAVPARIDHARDDDRRVGVEFDVAEGGLTISTYASALQGGAVGDTIPLRNKESGLVVSGTIQADGSVRVSNG